VCLSAAAAISGPTCSPRTPTTQRSRSSDALLAGIAAGEFAAGNNPRLWSLALTTHPHVRQELAEQMLVHASPAHVSSVRNAVLDALPAAHGDALAQAARDALRENATSVSAFRLLVRTGDEASQIAALESLSSRQAGALLLAPELGAVATETVLARLRASAGDGVEGAAIYLTAVTGLKAERLKDEMSRWMSVLSRSLAYARGRTDLPSLLLQKHVALAIEKAAPGVATAELERLLEAEVEAGGTAKRYLVQALARVREALAR
jgi:hypothetical protein